MTRTDGPRMPKRKTKLHAVWCALRRRHGLNTIEAQVLGDTVLPASIFQLRAAGWLILDEWELVKTRYGSTRFKRYFLTTQS